jgi:hypothetical protein
MLERRRQRAKELTASGRRKHTQGDRTRRPTPEVRRPTHTPTLVVLPRGYRRDLGEPKLWAYIQPMTLVLMMVVLAFGLLYVAVVAEERQMQEATKPRKR